MTILVFGSANLDLTLLVGRSPEAGETVTGRGLRRGLGGKGINQAVAAARLGGRTTFVGRVGDDEGGRLLTAGMAREGIRHDDMAIDDEADTGLAVVTVEDGGVNRIIVVPGANAVVGEVELSAVEQRLPDARILLVQLELPLPVVEAAVDLAAEYGVRVLLDPAPAAAGGLPSACYAPHVTVTPNETEAQALVGFPVDTEPAIVRAADVLLGRGAGAAVLKLGGRGLAWADALTCARLPAPPTEVVDSTGAGDAVNGALAVALSDGGDLAAAATYGAVAGSLAVGRPGAYDSMPTRAEVAARLAAASADR